jgi:hypothetical protein
VKISIAIPSDPDPECGISIPIPFRNTAWAPLLALPIAVFDDEETIHFGSKVPKLRKLDFLSACGQNEEKLSSNPFLSTKFLNF